MPFASRYNKIKAKIPAIKQLFQARHYIQCADECKRLLASTKYKDIHPVHKACIHFYFALSHDTMARDSSMKTRSAQLDLAEKHYLAAIKALTPPPPPKKLDNIQELQSPTTSTSSDEPNFIDRRPSTGSFNSEHSIASSETSYAEDEDFFADWESKRSSRADASLLSPTFYEGQSFSRKLSQRKRPSSIVTNPRQSYYKEQFTSNLCAFTCMVEFHLAGVRELKAAPITSGFRTSVSHSRGSTIASRPTSRDSGVYGDAAGMQFLREHRQSVMFRPRFDPSGVRELCQEALAEL